MQPSLDNTVYLYLALFFLSDFVLMYAVKLHFRFFFKNLPVFPKSSFPLPAYQSTEVFVLFL